MSFKAPAAAALLIGGIRLQFKITPDTEVLDTFMWGFLSALFIIIGFEFLKSWIKEE